MRYFYTKIGFGDKRRCVSSVIQRHYSRGHSAKAIA